MYNFFIENSGVLTDGYKIIGKDYNHIKNVLRMKTGEDLLVTINGKSNLCCITEITSDSVIVKLIKEDYNATELPIKITLFQGISKGEKMDFVPSARTACRTHRPRWRRGCGAHRWTSAGQAR